MIQDVDIPVAVAGIGLCAQLCRAEMLEEADILKMYNLVSEADGRIRARAGEFINDYHLQNVVPALMKARSPSHKKYVHS